MARDAISVEIGDLFNDQDIGLAASLGENVAEIETRVVIPKMHHIMKVTKAQVPPDTRYIAGALREAIRNATNQVSQ